MVLRLFLKAPYFLFRIWLCGRRKPLDYEYSYRVIRHVCKKANHAGRVRIEAHGIENLPGEDGFIFFPNHQGLYDVLSIIDSCERSFAFVIKKEASGVILLKQIVEATGSLAIDRDDLRQSMQVINGVAEQVRSGRNFLIFAEGTRSRRGNNMNEMKGGSFKCATKARCPIVPVALIDSFRPFDEKSVKPVTVHVNYLEPVLYEEYKGMKTGEIARLVRGRIETAIAAHLKAEGRGEELEANPKAKGCGMEPEANPKAKGCGMEPEVNPKAKGYGMEPEANPKAKGYGMEPEANPKAKGYETEPGTEEAGEE